MRAAADLSDTRASGPKATDPVVIRGRNRSILKALVASGITINVFLAIALVYLFSRGAPYFNLRNVEVTGNHKLSVTEVIEAAEIESGVNLLTVELNSIVMRLKRHPWLRSAAVYRRFPDQLVIEVEERTPRGVMAADKLYYLDENAEIFTRLFPGDSIDYPLFTGLKPNEITGNALAVQDTLRNALGLVDKLDKFSAELSVNELSEIRLSLDEGITLLTRSGQFIVLGKGNFESKLTRYGQLKKLLADKGEWRHARVINLDFDDRAIVRSSAEPLHQG